MCARTITTVIYTCGHRQEQRDTATCGEVNSEECNRQRENVQTMGSTRSREKCSTCKPCSSDPFSALCALLIVLRQSSLVILLSKSAEKERQEAQYRLWVSNDRSDCYGILTLIFGQRCSPLLVEYTSCALLPCSGGLETMYFSHMLDILTILLKLDSKIVNYAHLIDYTHRLLNALCS